MDAHTFDIVIGGVNLLILVVGAWIKSDLSTLKLYMHKNFVTREELYQLLARSNVTVFPTNQNERQQR